MSFDKSASVSGDFGETAGNSVASSKKSANSEIDSEKKKSKASEKENVGALNSKNAENVASEFDADADAGIKSEKSGSSSSEQSACENNAFEATEEESDALSDDLVQAAADALETAQSEVAEWKDKYLRLHAEWDTYRRRTNEQRANEKALATEKLVSEILPVLDDFERTISYATENGEAGLLDGVRAVQTKLHGVLEKSGLEQINPEGEAFDALQHQAVATVENAEVFDETVNEVYQKGYKMGSKVLRPAMVTVTTGGPERPKEDESDEGNDE